MNLQYKILKARKQANLSQQALGKIIGVSDKAVSAYEVGRSTPPLKILEKISNATGKPLPYFIESHSVTSDDILSKLDEISTEIKTLREQIQNPSN